MQNSKPIGLIFAMREEQLGLEQHFVNTKEVFIAKRRYLQGELWGKPCISVRSGIGKVAAATTCTQLIQAFDVDHIVLTGVAGSADPKLRVGDVVVAKELIQHDMNAFPFFPKFEIPLTGISRFKTANRYQEALFQASLDFIHKDFQHCLSPELIEQFQLQTIQCLQGLIASGDQFINDSAHVAKIKEELPDCLAFEMEGAAIAQVCHDFDMPFALLRTISDNANEHAIINFAEFIKEVASIYSLNILKNYFKSL
jgi:adenosylhomocysteine nucleosidase